MLSHLVEFFFMNGKCEVINEHLGKYDMKNLPGIRRYRVKFWKNSLSRKDHHR